MVAVVRAEHDQRVLCELVLIESCHEAADVGVHPGDHRGLALVGVGPFFLGVNPVVRHILPVPGAASALVVGVWNGERQVEEKRLLVIHVQPVQGVLDDEIMRVIDALFRPAGAAGEFICWDVAELHAPLVVDEKCRVEIMRVPLVQVAVKGIEPLFGRQPVGALVAESPFAKAAGRVTGLLEQLRHGEVAGPEVVSAVTTNIGVSGVEPGHQHAARRRADG